MYIAHDRAYGSLHIRLIPSMTPSPAVCHRPIAGIAAHGIANSCDLLRNLNPHIGDPSQPGLDLLVAGIEHGRVGGFHRLIEIAADAEQLHSDRGEFGKEAVIDPRFELEGTTHHNIDTPCAISRTLPCAEIGIA